MDTLLVSVFKHGSCLCAGFYAPSLLPISGVYVIASILISILSNVTLYTVLFVKSATPRRILVTE